MNIYEEAALEGAVLRDDEKVLRPILEGVALMIDQNPFSGRIWSLLTNARLATKPVLNTKGEIIPPNCLGTVFFVAGVGSFDYPYHAYDDELNQHLKQPGPKDWSDSFRIHLDRRIPGAFCFSCDGVNADWHAGIYLGLVGDEHVFFAQHGSGGIFCLELMRYYPNSDYYIPRTLPGGR